MLVRIVKLSFRPEEVEHFISIFNENKGRIVQQRGCHSVELLREAGGGNVLFTRSLWDSEEELNAYRQSDLFRSTWARVKPLFSDKPQAWSLEWIGGDKK